jgi:hypothetical protein
MPPRRQEDFAGCLICASDALDYCFRPLGSLRPCCHQRVLPSVRSNLANRPDRGTAMPCRIVDQMRNCALHSFRGGRKAMIGRTLH